MVRWFARKPKVKAPVLKAPADRVRVRRVRRDLLEVEPLAVESGAPELPGDTPAASAPRPEPRRRN